MTIRSLLLGSIAVAGLATGAQAADLGVLTSLDVCDALGISGLTISSDTNCLQITGGVNYEFYWGDYRASGATAGSSARLGLYNDPFDGTATTITAGGFNGRDQDWQSHVEAWLTATGTQDSDFGPAKAVITLKFDDHPRFWNEYYGDNDGNSEGAGTGVTASQPYFDEAYVAIGDSTVIMAGKKQEGADGSVANLGDDNPFNYLGTFISSGVDGGGVLIDGDSDFLGGDSVQVVSDLGNGLSVQVGLENIDADETTAAIQGTPAYDSGTLIGVLQYASEGVTAHITGAAVGVLDGDVESWFVHAGATGTFDAFKVRAAAAYSHFGEVGADTDNFHGLLSAQGTFDLFTIALSGEYANIDNNVTGQQFEAWGVGGSVGAKITDGVAINLGARYFHGENEFVTVASGLRNEELLQISANIVASVTETIKVTAEVGGYFNDDRSNSTAFRANEFNDGLYYGGLEVAWAPGGGFKSSLKGEVNTTGAYRTTFKASKTFE